VVARAIIRSIRAGADAALLVAEAHRRGLDATIGRINTELGQARAARSKATQRAEAMKARVAELEAEVARLRRAEALPLTTGSDSTPATGPSSAPRGCAAPQRVRDEPLPADALAGYRIALFTGLARRAAR
jgi:hypothetical protein